MDYFDTSCYVYPPIEFLICSHKADASFWKIVWLMENQENHFYQIAFKKKIIDNYFFYK